MHNDQNDTEPVPTDAEPVPSESEPVPTDTEPEPTDTEPVREPQAISKGSGHTDW